MTISPLELHSRKVCSIALEQNRRTRLTSRLFGIGTSLQAVNPPSLGSFTYAALLCNGIGERYGSTAATAQSVKACRILRVHARTLSAALGEVPRRRMMEVPIPSDSSKRANSFLASKIGVRYLNTTRRTQVNIYYSAPELVFPVGDPRDDIEA